MARRQVSIYINGRQVNNTIKSIYSEKRKLNAELNRMTIGTEEYEKKVRDLARVNGILDDHRNKIRNTGSTWEKLTKGGITKLAGLAAGAFAADQIIQYGTELFKLGNEMQLLERKAQTVFAQTLPQVTLQAERNAAAMGLTTSQYIDQAAAIADLLIPMKFQREEAAQISTELVNLSGALSEWTGGQIDAENVSKILGKAILGEREELKQLGISIQEADVKARLAEKGLSNLTGEMLQQAKASATLELILEKSTDAQAAFASNADLGARKQAELSARLQEVSEKLAIALIPVFNRLVIIAEDAVDILNSVADAVSKMSDPAAAAVKEFDAQTAAVHDLEQNLVPLLDRYEELSAKSKLSADEQEELKKLIAQIGDITPTAITEIDNYGNALSINAGKSREFLEAEKARLEYINQDAISALEANIKSLQSQRAILDRAITTGRGGLLNVEYDPSTINQFRSDLAQITRQIQGAQAELARLTGDNLNTPEETNSNSSISPTAEERAAQEEAAALLRKQREKQREQELKDRQRHLEQLSKLLTKHYEDERLSGLSDDDRALEQVRLRYQKEIDLALALEAKGVSQATEARKELERLRDAELLQLRLDQNQARFEAENEQLLEQQQERLANEKAFALARAEANRQIQEITRQTVLGEEDLALIELSEQYDSLIALAQQYGLDTLDIEIAYRREQERIRREFDERAVKETAEQQQKLAQNYAQTFSSLAGVIGSAIDLAGNKSRDAVALQKLLTLAQIGLSSAAAIAQATAAGAAAGPFPANLAAIATGVATVLGNIAQARSVFAEVPQFFEGGWTAARGAQDGRTYRAKYIGQPGTGRLPGHAVLMDTSIGTVLASERGSEYFVSNSAMRNPQVLNHVRAIDNIVRYRQFAEGGATNPVALTTSDSTADLAAITMELNSSIQQLNTILSSKIYAVIDNQTVIDIRDQMEKIAQASGGAA